MKINQIVNEDIPVADIAAMATVAGLAYPVMKAMIKAAYKTGKGFLKLKKIANKAGIKLADRAFENGISTRTNFTRNGTNQTFSKYIQKSTDTGGTSLSKVSNLNKTAGGTTGTTTKRFVRPGGSGTNTTYNHGTGKTTRTNFQLKGPQTWAYDKPKLNASKKIKEDGVIVPGVNTTVDVKPGQTEKEAAKFFGHGKPKELHKKARKNSKPNTLYNLGLAEDKKSDKADDMAGFDPATAMAVKKLQAKYPHAENIMSAMMASTQDTLALQHTMDKKHNRKFQELEKKLLDLIKKNNLKA